MRRLREAIRQKLTELRKNQTWIFHHDNAPAHTLITVRKFLAKNKIVIMLQPPYSLVVLVEEKLCHKCIIFEGGYIDLDKIVFDKEMLLEKN